MTWRMEPRQCDIPWPRSPLDRCFARSFRGRSWCFSDCGQAQVEFTAPACGAVGGFLECDILQTRNVCFWWAV